MYSGSYRGQACPQPLSLNILNKISISNLELFLIPVSAIMYVYNGSNMGELPGLTYNNIYLL